MAGLASTSAVDDRFWRDRRVFVTGHTGFKGSWLALWLQRLGAEVAGYALDPPTTPSLFEEADVVSGMTHIVADIRDAERLARAVAEFRPEVVLHLAAQALVRPSYVDPAETFSVNVLGVAHLLDAVRACDDVRVTIVVTSDKCYENRERIRPYREDDRLGGHDPYSASKACAELLTASYRASFFSEGSPAVASARAGNVLGGGDWSPERLVPDLVRALLGDEELVLRYPGAVRPWQHVLDPLGGYLVLAQALWERRDLAGPWNFAPSIEEAWTVERIVGRLAEILDRPAVWRQHPGPLLHEARSLRLDASKARAELAWVPRFTVEETLASVGEWYAGHAAGRGARELVDADLDRYHRLVSP
jgi:CDP-glucose 4,6-dehydratase